MNTMSTARDEGNRTKRPSRASFAWMVAGAVVVGVIAGSTAAGPGPVPLLGAVLAVAVYWVVMRRLVHRSTPEIAWQGAVGSVLSGIAVGLGFVLVSVGLITAFGGYSFSWTGNGVWAVVWSAVVVQCAAAVTEELMFRGFVLQAVEQWWGSGVALAVTGVLFGAVHVMNPGATLWSAVAIAVEAGVMLGAAFVWRRSIWFVVGLHFAWNTAVQLLGIPVSGHSSEGLFAVESHGAVALTGGAFGLEASIVPVVTGVLISVSMLVFAHRGGSLRARPVARSASRVAAEARPGRGLSD